MSCCNIFSFCFLCSRDLLLPFFCSAKLTARSHAVVFLLQKSASVPIQRKPNVRHTHIHPLHRTTQTHSTPKL
jgi:hypothetical protein